MGSEIITTNKDYFIYTASVAALVSGASSTDVVSVEADANFILEKMAYFATLAGAAQTDADRVVPLINISITDTGSGRNLQDNPVPINSLAGTGELPFILPVARRFNARSSINVTFENFSAATDYANINLALIGYKTFRN